ncbi:methionine synthase reductase isoform X2 [Gouania willdenowi]|nr:methionine synthase reductase isoform X2 [Gouania willdenowi]XP_028289969.1 methionine synthase reductase isoform X2 [Gouania willdenowi]
MPCEVTSRFVLLYGSQKGQAQSIAEGIAEEAKGHGLAADLSCLDQNDKYNLEEENSPVVFIVSTTGDGEAPDNALQFVKRIRRKTLTSDHFKHLCYALLALGDTNYANFCNCGKTIERRLQELGAKQFYATGFADDGIGLELVVDPWLEGLWNAIKGVLPNMASDRSAHLKENAEESKDLFSPDVRLNLLTIGERQDCTSAGTAGNAGSKHTSAVSSSTSAACDRGPASPAGGPQCDAAASAPTESQSRDVGLSTVLLASSLTHSLPPLSVSALNVPTLPPLYLKVSLQESDTCSEMTGPINREVLREVNISKALQMTRDDSVKTALLLELDISPYPEMIYQPGDSFDVYCPNRTTEVDNLLHRLSLYNQKHCLVNISLIKDTKKKGAQVPSHIPEKASLHFLFSWCLEIRSVPKKAFVRALVEHTCDSVHRRRLQELCSKQGAADYNLYVRDASLSLMELLTAFPSCSPPLSLLIEHLPKLQPRPYSAASSCLRHPGKLRFVFNVVEFPASSERLVKRRGLCTGWMFDLIHSGPFSMENTESSDSLPLPKIHVSLRSSCSFRPPSDPSVPYIMVGPGTGVAPFIGFLQHREETRKTHPDRVLGNTWLFYGCRHKDRDYLFREDLEGFVSSGTLTHLKVCFSRDDAVNDGSTSSAHPTKYVQHNLRRHSRHVTDILLKQNGVIYVCGDAKNMAKDVNEALVEMIRDELKVDQLDAMKHLATLREQKRYLQDIWA